MSSIGIRRLAVALSAGSMLLWASADALATNASFGSGTAVLLYGNSVEIGDIDGASSPAPEIVSGNAGLGNVSHLHVLHNDGAIVPSFSSLSLDGAANALAIGKWSFSAGSDRQIMVGIGNSILLYSDSNPTPVTLSSTHGAISLEFYSADAHYLYYTTGDSAGYLRYNGVSLTDTPLRTGGASDSYLAIDIKGGVRVITGSGGTFSLPAGVGSSGSGRDVDHGDVDGDAIDDVVIAKDNQIVWVGCTDTGSCVGDHDVSPVETFLTWVDVETADIDSDGDLDVVASWEPSGPGPYVCWGEVSWFESSGGAAPTFTEHRVSCGTSTARPRQVAAGDLDGDGDVDLASTGSTNLLPGLGSTGYRLNQLAFWLAEGALRQGLGRTVLGHADFNHDGFPDAVIASHCSFSNQGGCPMVAPLRDQVDVYLGTATGLAAASAWNAIGEQEFEAFGSSLATGDWNADGYTDLAIGAPTYKGGCDTTYGERVGRVYVWYGGPADAGNPAGFGDSGTPANADALLVNTNAFPHGENALCYASPPEGFGADLASGDRTGDGIDDLALSDPGYFHFECYPNTIPGRGRVRVYRGGTTGLGLLETVEGPTCSPSQCSADGCGGNGLGHPLELGDVDGDHRADLIMSQLFRSSSDVVRVAYASGSTVTMNLGVPADFALADVNGDGYRDLAAAGETGARVWLGGASGLTATAWSPAYPSDGHVPGYTRISSAGQASADCNEDLALAAPTTSDVKVFRGQAGTAGPISTPEETIPIAWQSIALAGDVRRDGIDDLLAGSSSATRYAQTNASGLAELYQGEAGVAAGSIPDCDGDGSRRNVDCDDGNAAVYPGAVEVCNLRDDDCDNQVDEGLGCVFADSDGDGILDDGDHSGSTGDHPCTGGATQGCDDNCRVTANADQADGDADAVGNVCDNCAALANADQANGDGDALGDVCDNCPTLTNDQADADADAVGDVCDSCTAMSNPRVASDFLTANPWATVTGRQRDDDHDGYGNICDAKFPGVGGALVGSNDLAQLRASNGKNRTTDTCGTSSIVPCAIFDLDQIGTLIGSGDLSRFRVLNGKLPGPRCPTCPLACESGPSGNCN